MKSLKAFAIVLMLVLGAALIPGTTLPANYIVLDTTYQQQSNIEVNPIIQGCDSNCCNKKNKGNKEVPLGKNPNLNNPDTNINNIKPEEVK
mgnify:CR=1 FL=1